MIFLLAAGELFVRFPQSHRASRIPPLDWYGRWNFAAGQLIRPSANVAPEQRNQATETDEQGRKNKDKHQTRSTTSD